MYEVVQCTSMVSLCRTASSMDLQPSCRSTGVICARHGVFVTMRAALFKVFLQALALVGAQTTPDRGAICEMRDDKILNQLCEHRLS